MSPKNFLTRISGLRHEKRAEKVGYDEIFQGEASSPATSVAAGNYLPGLRPLTNDVDTYFKDVFAGPVF